MFSSMHSSQFSVSFHALNACCSRVGAAVEFAPSPLPSGRTSPDGVSKSYFIRYKVSLLCLSTFMSFRLYCAASDFSTFCNLVRPSGLICSSCSYSRDFPSNFLSHGSLPPRSCFVPAPRALTLAGQTLCVWLVSLTAAGCFVLQVWDSASSRLRADFHRSAHISRRSYRIRRP